MPAARIIPCLDVANGRVVKGVRFRDHRDMGAVAKHAARYRDEGADELVFYDILASVERRSIDRDWIREVSDLLDIPFCVAGGISDAKTAGQCLTAGADKVSINSPALAKPELITELADAFGSQCVVVGIDSEASSIGWTVKQYTGSADATVATGRSTLGWAKEAAERGAGEIVLNCMDQDGVRKGYDLEQLEAIVEQVNIPVIASGGAGTMQHFAEAFRVGVSGALAASVFHERRIAIPELKQYLAGQGLEVRI